MTKKDYVQFAAMVQRMSKRASTLDCDQPSVICGEFAESLADIFKADNPRFDRERFLKACGVE